MLGSRSARRAVHGGVRGVHEADVPLLLAAHLGQGRLRGTDRGVRRLLLVGGVLYGVSGPGVFPVADVRAS